MHFSLSGCLAYELRMISDVSKLSVLKMYVAINCAIKKTKNVY